MALTVRELITKWGFDVDDKPLKKMDAKIAELKSSLFMVGGAAAAAAGTLFGIAKTTADAGDHALKMSQKLGIGVEALQELQFAAKLSDVSSEQLGQSLGLLSKNLTAAKGGNKEAIKSFAVLGEKVSGLVRVGAPTDDVLGAIADRFSRMPDGAKKATIAMDLFGKSGKDLIPLLNQGSKGIEETRKRARELGVVLSEDTAQASEVFNDSLTELFGALTGVRNIIGSKLIPMLTPLIQALTDWIAVNKELIAQDLGEIVSALGDFLKFTFKWASALVRSIIQMSKVFGGLNNILKIAVGLFALFAAFRTISAIGGIAMAVFDVIKAIRGLNIALMIANAQALLIPALIGLAIIALGLIIEDVVAFFQGKDSITGRVVGWFQEAFPTLTTIIKQVFEVVKFYIMTVIAQFQLWVKVIGAVANAIASVLMPVFTWLWENGLKPVLDAMAKIFSFGGSILTKVLGVVSGAAVEGQKALASQGLGGLTPSTAPVTNAQNNTSQQNNVKVEVNVPPGTDPSMVGNAVSSGVQKSLDNVLRPTQRAFAGGVAY